MRYVQAILILVVTLYICAAPVHCEEPSGALSGFATSRSWADSEGKFKIDAQLKSADEENVQLKKSDGRIVTVPIAKLSEADKAFINGFMAAAKAMNSLNSTANADSGNPFAGGEPDTSSSAAADAVRESKPASKDTEGVDATVEGESDIPTRRAITRIMKPLPLNLGIKWSIQPLVPFPEVELGEIVTTLSIKKPFFSAFTSKAAGKKGIAILNVYQEGRNRDGFSEFALVNATTGESTEPTRFSQPWKIMAITPGGDRFAAVRVEGWDKGNDLALFKIVDDRIIPEFQFQAGGGSWNELQWVGFIPGNRLATISQQHNLTIWDLSNPSMVKATHRGSSGGTLFAVSSAAGDILALPVGLKIAFVDTNSLRCVGTITREVPANAFAFSSDGKRFAAYHPFNLTIYDMVTGNQINQIPVTESNPNAFMGWVGSRVKVGSMVYDVDRSIPLWTYDSQATHQQTLGNYLISCFAGDHGSTMCITKLPHDGVDNALASADTSDIYAITPGSPVSLRYSLDQVAGDKRAEIEKVLNDKLNALGWVISSSADTTIDISIEKGEQGTAEYYTRRGMGPFFLPPPGFGGIRPTGPAETITFTPWSHKFTITKGGAELFTASYEATAPSNLQTDEKETTQAAVDRICQPNPAWFQNLNLSPHLPKPEFQGGLGKSTIDGNGLH